MINCMAENHPLIDDIGRDKLHNAYLTLVNFYIQGIKDKKYGEWFYVAVQIPEEKKDESNS